MDGTKNQSTFVVTARKWRPQNFKDVVGQEHIVTTLLNAIKLNRIHHAYLFCGPRGVGKTTTARILARAVNCLNPKDAEPCNECENCHSILDSRSMDVIEIDGASNNSVDDIRKLRENARYAPSSGRYKMYVIDEVHMLSNAAFNALLKILEEPPPHLIFVFATTEAHKVLPTITSRCQRYDFRRMEIDDIVNQLKYISERENIKIDEESLVVIAKKGDGSMRDSQSIYDQVIAFCGKEVKFTEMANALHLVDTEFFFRIHKAVKTTDRSELFRITDEIVRKGYDYGEILEGLLEFYRNIAAIKATDNPKIIEASKDEIERYKQEIKDFTHEDLIRIMNKISEAEHNLRFASLPRIRFELLLQQIASLGKTSSINELISEIKNLRNVPELSNLNNLTKLVSNNIVQEKPISYEVNNNQISYEAKSTQQKIEIIPEKIEILPEKVEKNTYEMPKEVEPAVSKINNSDLKNNLNLENSSKKNNTPEISTNLNNMNIEEMLVELFYAKEVME